MVTTAKNPLDLLKKGFKTLEIRNNRYVIVDNPAHSGEHGNGLDHGNFLYDKRFR